MRNIKHFPITQASLISALTFVVGQLVAFVPAFGADKQVLISAGSAVIAAIFLVANAVHALADSNVSAKDVEDGAIAAARSEVGKVDFTGLVQSAVDAKSPADLEALVEAKARQVIAGLLGSAASAVPVAPAPVVAAPSVAPAVPPAA